MKKIMVVILSIILVFSTFSITAFANNTSLTTEEDYIKKANELFSKNTDDEVKLIMILSLMELYDRGVYEDAVIKEVFDVLNGDNTRTLNETEYVFGQGTYVVGKDIRAGTFDITCEATRDDTSESIGYLGDLYSSMGMDDYAAMFGSLGGIAESVNYMTVDIKNEKGQTQKYLTLKPGETARITLKDGMTLELEDGNAKLIFIR